MNSVTNTHPPEQSVDFQKKLQNIKFSLSEIEKLSLPVDVKDAITNFLNKDITQITSLDLTELDEKLETHEKHLPKEVLSTGLKSAKKSSTSLTAIVAIIIVIVSPIIAIYIRKF